MSARVRNDRISGRYFLCCTTPHFILSMAFLRLPSWLQIAQGIVNLITVIEVFIIFQHFKQLLSISPAEPKPC